MYTANAGLDASQVNTHKEPSRRLDIECAHQSIMGQVYNHARNARTRGLFARGLAVAAKEDGAGGTPQAVTERDAYDDSSLIYTVYTYRSARMRWTR